MGVQNPYQQYQQNSVMTASPGELTLMLYNGCLKFLGLAKTAINERDFEAKNTNIQKAQNIIRELMVTLNRDLEIAEQFLVLYDYLYERLLQANLANDVAIIEEVEGFISEFRDTWKEVIRLNRQQQYTETGQV